MNNKVNVIKRHVMTARDRETGERERERETERERERDIRYKGICAVAAW